jgi:hypothetical protein
MFCRSLLVLLYAFFWPLCCSSSYTDSDYSFDIFKLFLHQHSYIVNCMLCLNICIIFLTRLLLNRKTLENSLSKTNLIQNKGQHTHYQKSPKPTLSYRLRNGFLREKSESYWKHSCLITKDFIVKYWFIESM